jgi:LysR family transcriptional activator of dmlA
VNSLPGNEDLRVFAAVVRDASFSAAAQALGMSPAYVSKRVRVLETQLGTRLLDRTTRRVIVTEEGQRVMQHAQRILADLEQLVQEVGAARRMPRGHLRISASFGFGRERVAPAVSALVERYPQLQVRLEVFDRLVDVAAEGFDLDVRVGDEIAPHLVARKLAANHRVLCAAPTYIARHGSPRKLAELAQHACLAIKERDHPFGVWRLQSGNTTHTVKVTGPLSTNHGEVAVRWALDGRGIVLRSLWDVAPLLQAGRLVQVLPEFRQDANVWAVMPARQTSSAKVRACVDFLAAYLARTSPPPLSS